jgi:hypothetical protein
MTEQIDETSKEKAARYVVKAAADRHKQHVNYSDALDKKIKAGTALKRVKNAGPDTEYGETDSEHAERVNRLSKRRGNAEKEQDTAGRKEANRLVGMYRAGKILAKEEVEMSENLENILVHAWNKDAVNLRDALDAEMQSRISDHVDSMVADVSARLFNPSNEEHEG